MKKILLALAALSMITPAVQAKRKTYKTKKVKKVKKKKKAVTKKQTTTTTTKTTTTTTRVKTQKTSKKKVIRIKKAPKIKVIDLDWDLLSDYEMNRNLNAMVYSCGIPGLNAYCFMGVVLEEKEWDDGFFTSEREEAVSDAKDIVEDCITERHYSLDSVVRCINSDARPGYEVTEYEICNSERYETLKEALEEENTGYINQTCR